MLFRQSLNDVKTVSVTPLITFIIFVFPLQIGYMCVLSSLHYGIFSVLLLITFLSPEIAMTVNICVLFIIMDYRV